MGDANGGSRILETCLRAFEEPNSSESLMISEENTKTFTWKPSNDKTSDRSFHRKI